MGRIRPLSENLIGKIAAGEVVERPAAAIKELVENSLDAGASAVTVEIREGGMDLIRVTDNGSGIDESDIRMAFERHATSKISREQDLFSIQTLGFFLSTYITALERPSTTMDGLTDVPSSGNAVLGPITHEYAHFFALVASSSTSAVGVDAQRNTFGVLVQNCLFQSLSHGSSSLI